MTTATGGSAEAQPIGPGYDAVVVGAGMAGAAPAESLVARSDLSVLVCDATPVPGAPSSGRSVAVFGADVVAVHAAELILGLDPSVDLGPYAPSRLGSAA